MTFDIQLNCEEEMKIKINSGLERSLMNNSHPFSILIPPSSNITAKNNNQNQEEEEILNDKMELSPSLSQLFLASCFEENQFFHIFFDLNDDGSPPSIQFPSSNQSNSSTYDQSSKRIPINLLKPSHLFDYLCCSFCENEPFISTSFASNSSSSSQNTSFESTTSQTIPVRTYSFPSLGISFSFTIASDSSLVVDDVFKSNSLEDLNNNNNMVFHSIKFATFHLDLLPFLLSDEYQEEENGNDRLLDERCLVQFHFQKMKKNKIKKKKKNGKNKQQQQPSSNDQKEEEEESMTNENESKSLYPFLSNHLEELTHLMFCSQTNNEANREEEEELIRDNTIILPIHQSSSSSSRKGRASKKKNENPIMVVERISSEEEEEDDEFHHISSPQSSSINSSHLRSQMEIQEAEKETEETIDSNQAPSSSSSLTNNSYHQDGLMVVEDVRILSSSNFPSLSIHLVNHSVHEIFLKNHSDMS